MCGRDVFGGASQPNRLVVIFKSRVLRFRAFTFVTVLVLPLTVAWAQSSVCLPRTASAGINTSRLKGKDLAQWCSIERLVVDVDEEGQPRYPLLRYLFKWAEFSEHSIYIEFPKTRRSRFTAGSFHIERFDRCGIKQEVVIRLYLETIDRVYIGDITRRGDGLIPFAGLSKDGRCAEVLGHELAHAFDILSDFRLTRKVEEEVQQTNTKFIAFRSQFQSRPLDPHLQELLTVKDALLERLESSAMEFEKIIWEELRDGGKVGSALSLPPR